MTHPFADYAGDRKLNSTPQKSHLLLDMGMRNLVHLFFNIIFTSTIVMYKELDSEIQCLHIIPMCILVVICSTALRTPGPVWLQN